MCIRDRDIVQWWWCCRFTTRTPFHPPPPAHHHHDEPLPRRVQCWIEWNKCRVIIVLSSTTSASVQIVVVNKGGHESDGDDDEEWWWWWWSWLDYCRWLRNSWWCWWLLDWIKLIFSLGCICTVSNRVRHIILLLRCQLTCWTCCHVRVRVHLVPPGYLLHYNSKHTRTIGWCCWLFYMMVSCWYGWLGTRMKTV